MVDIIDVLGAHHPTVEKTVDALLKALRFQNGRSWKQQWGETLRPQLIVWLEQFSTPLTDLWFKPSIQTHGSLRNQGHICIIECKKISTDVNLEEFWQNL